MPIPKLRRHRPTKQGVVTLCGTDHYLGVWPRDAPESVRAKYDRLVREWLDNGRKVIESAPVEAVQVRDLIVEFWKHAEQHYRHEDGTPTSELDEYRQSFRPLRKLFVDIPISEFSPLNLRSVRDDMIDAGLSRNVINRRVARIVRAFKWGVSVELVPVDVWTRLTTLQGLLANRTTARETDDVEPVADVVVEATLAKLNPTVAAMVRLQRLTGMRPGEVRAMRAEQIDRSGDVWVYGPPRHKSAWRGKSRRIFIGPRAQAILTPFLDPNHDGYVFSPRLAEEQRSKARRAERKSPVQPSQRDRRKANATRRPGESYTRFSYNQAIRRACIAAKVEIWSPNQLRHTAATEIRARYGLEAAQIVLGHANANVTQVYAERDASNAVEVALAVG